MNAVLFRNKLISEFKEIKTLHECGRTLLYFRSVT